MLRVYDKQKELWLKGDFCIMSNGDLAELKKMPFGLEKINLLSDDRYFWHEDIGAYDINGNLIFEGDICELNLGEESIYCIVAYIEQRAAYLLFDEKNLSYYQFNEHIFNALSVISNVFDGQDILDSYVNSMEIGTSKDGE